jgi:hypothetical protein
VVLGFLSFVSVFAVFDFSKVLDSLLFLRFLGFGVLGFLMLFGFLSIYLLRNSRRLPYLGVPENIVPEQVLLKEILKSSLLGVPENILIKEFLEELLMKEFFKSSCGTPHEGAPH